MSVGVHSFSFMHYLQFCEIASKAANQDTIFLYQCQIIKKWKLEMSSRFSSSLLSRNVNCTTWKHTVSELVHLSQGRTLCCKSRFLKNNWKNKQNKVLLLFIICATTSSSWCPPRSDVLLHLKLLNFNAAMAISGRWVHSLLCPV